MYVCMLYKELQLGVRNFWLWLKSDKKNIYIFFFERPVCELYVTLRVFVEEEKCFKQKVQGIMKLLCKF